MHNIEKSKNEILQVVKICNHTLQKRLYEFTNTKAGSLTLKDLDDQELMNNCVWFTLHFVFLLKAFLFIFSDEESDPPAYRLLREIEKNQRELDEKKLNKIMVVGLMEEDSLESLNRQLDGDIKYLLFKYLFIVRG
jgi:hypothetical protein